MRLKHTVWVGAVLLVSGLSWSNRYAHAQADGGRVMHLAEIEVDPRHIEPYKAALREGIEAALRLEPGVLMLYAVSVKGHPEQVRLLEIYASQAAYQSHLETPHFRKYKAATQGMVRSLKLIDTDPILLASKP